MKAWSRLDIDSGSLDANRGLARRSRAANDLGLGRRRGYVRRPGHACRARPRSAILAAAGLFAVLVHGRRRLGPLLALGRHHGRRHAAARGPGRPCESTEVLSIPTPAYFEYNFSWTIHHYEKGNTLPSQFYTLNNLPEIVHVKLKSS